MRSGARTPKQLAADLGCTEQTLRNWLRQDEADRGERNGVLTSDERARLCTSNVRAEISLRWTRGVGADRFAYHRRAGVGSGLRVLQGVVWRSRGSGGSHPAGAGSLLRPSSRAA